MHLGRLPHTRAQSSGMIVFLLIIAVGVIWGLLDVGMGQLFTSTLGQTSSQQATDVIKQRRAIWNNVPYFFIIFGGILIIARAAVQSRT